jgi:acetoin utilization protein AcuB
MNLDLLTDKTIPVLSLEDSIEKSLSVMDDAKLTGLPVVSGDDYIAFVLEDTLLEHPDPSQTLLASGLLTYKPAIGSHAHPFDAITIIHQTALPLLPVLDIEQKYSGCITKDNLLGYITNNSGIANPGGILVLEILPRNYSMYEIARICENEDVILLAMHAHTNERGMLEITMKLNRTVLDGVVASFERHNYHVQEVYGKDTNNEDIIGKYNLLMNYINM